MTTPLPTANEIARRRLIISGKVQGVYYRVSMVAAAQTHGVTGWVRNRSDGTVEALIVGDSESVAKLLMWARRGPPESKVEHILIELGEGDFDDFSQLETITV